jgi:hypothetical protein
VRGLGRGATAYHLWDAFTLGARELAWSCYLDALDPEREAAGAYEQRIGAAFAEHSRGPVIGGRP